MYYRERGSHAQSVYLTQDMRTVRVKQEEADKIYNIKRSEKNMKERNLGTMGLTNAPPTLD